MSNIEELPIPDLAINGNKVAEMARIWLVDGDQVVTISSRLWPNPGAWGLMLVDFAKHLAKAYAHKGFDEDEALKLIRNSMDIEWEHPTE